MEHLYIQLPTVVPDMGRYDADKGWGQHGLSSCAHWLQWRCGI